MSILTGNNPFSDYKKTLEEKKGPCWTGHKKVPGKKDFEPGSCVKEEEQTVTEGEINDRNRSFNNGTVKKYQPHKKPPVVRIRLNNDGSHTDLNTGHTYHRDGRVEKMKEEDEGFEDYWNSLTEDEQIDYVEAVFEEEGCGCPDCADGLEEESLQEKGADGKGHFRSTESGAGMTSKGVASYKRDNPGSKLSTAVTTPPSKLKAGSKAAGRRKSFCARSRSWTGERGKAARARWNC